MSGAEKTTRTPPIRVVFFGDSICYGQLVPPHLTWVTRIAARLHELALTLGIGKIRLSNASISGNTTRMALERMPYDVQSHGTDLCVVQFGLNDCNHWASDQGLPRVSPSAFAANLQEIAERAHKFGAKCVILNTNHPTIRTVETMPGTTKTFEWQNQRYNEIIRKVAADGPDWLELHDVEALWLEQIARTGAELDTYVLEDGLHLSEAGHDLYFDVTWPRIEDVIRQRFIILSRLPKS